MEVLLTILYSALFIFAISKLKFFSIENVSWKILAGIFVFKILSGICLTLIYTYYYKTRINSDIFKYFDDAKSLFNSIYDNPFDYLRIVTGIDSDAAHLRKYYNMANFWFKDFNYNLYNDNRTVIRFNMIVHLFSFGYFSVHTVFINFLSLTGLTAIFKTLYPYLKDKKIPLLISVFFLPSVIFWTSGVLKEGILIFAFGMLLYSASKLISQKIKIVMLINFLLALFLLSITKFYVLFAALPGLISMIWINKTRPRYELVKFFIVHLLFFVLMFNTQFLSNYNFIEILCKKQHDFVESVSLMKNVGSLINIPQLQPGIIDILKNAPVGFFNALVRPAITESYSFVVLFSAIENLLLITVLFGSILFMRVGAVSNKGLFCFSLSFFVILFVLTGMTTPVMGAMVRYKSPALPFFLVTILFLVDSSKVINTVREIREALKKGRSEK